MASIEILCCSQIPALCKYVVPVQERSPIAISRLSSLELSSTVLEEYSYLGLGTLVVRSHPQPGVDLSFVKLSGESVGDAGDQYTGLDRFGRIVDQRWRAGSTDKDRYQYTYDRNGNRLTRNNQLDSNFNETYTYDNLNQLASFSRTGRSQSWDYDAVGNWDSFTTNSTTQTRTHNKQNEITAVGGASPTFDANGNMTTDETGKQYEYDAWNRLVRVKTSGGSTLVAYEYDGLTRRIQETASSVTTDLYYSLDWQVLEERVSGNTTKTYVWSPVYVDAMVLRNRDTDANGSLDERLYVTHDANFNVTGLVNTSGTVVERSHYDPFGVKTVRDGSWNLTSTAYAWEYYHQGGRFSTHSELYHFRYREYSPTLGRWVTMDPIGYESNEINLFCYTDNSPFILLDPFGLDVHVYWIEGAQIDAPLNLIGGNNLEKGVITPLKNRFRDAKDVHWNGTYTGIGATIKIDARTIEESLSKICESGKDKIVLIGYIDRHSSSFSNGSLAAW